MNLNWCPLSCYVGGHNERTEKETYPVYPRIHCVVCSAFSVDLSWIYFESSFVYLVL